jgi:hypothetical protein
MRFRSKAAESETSLRQRAATWLEWPTLESLKSETLRQITQQEGVDFATALLFDRFCKSSDRSIFIQQIDTLRQSLRPLPATIDAKVVIVPGALYVERPDMGGDGRIVREVAASLGLKTDLIPLASFGSVRTNAGLIREWLKQHQREPIILVSLSKGGADLKLAMAELETSGLFNNVIAWINVCGPLSGSRMANWILESRIRTWFFQFKLRWQKRDFQFVFDLRHADDAPLGFMLQPPEPMQMVSLIGFPLHQHMTTRFSRFCHRTLAPYGPNDGTTSLSDLHSVPGEIYPVWGMDHYFRPESEARSLVAAILQYLAIKRSPPQNLSFSATAG